MEFILKVHTLVEQKLVVSHFQTPSQRLGKLKVQWEEPLVWAEWVVKDNAR